MSQSEGKTVFDERRQDRESLIYHLRVFDLATNKVIGYVDDITTEGARLLSDEPIQPNSVHKYRLELPQFLEGKRSIELNALTTWSADEQASANFYDCGLKFIDTSPIEKERLTQLICSYRL